jgi:hypothetical protein
LRTYVTVKKLADMEADLRSTLASYLPAAPDMVGLKNKVVATLDAKILAVRIAKQLLTGDEGCIQAELEEDGLEPMSKFRLALEMFNKL